MSDSPFHPRYWPTWLGLGLLRLLVLLPLEAQQAIGRTAGKVLAKTLKRRRHIAEVNIALCFPELSSAEQQQLVDDSLVAITLGAIETGFAWWATDEQILNCSTVEGIELIEEAKKQGRGVLLFGAHFSTLDLSGRVMGQRIDVDITYKNQKNKAFDYYVYRARQKYFKHVIHKNEMRRMIRHLREGRTVWYAPDQDFGREGSVFAPFFGQPAATLATAGKLLRMTNAKPLFISHYRLTVDGKTCYQGIVSDPFQDRFGEDEVANATLVNKAVEDAIRVHPEQYLWAHERFRTRENPEDGKIYTLRKKKPRKK